MGGNNRRKRPKIETIVVKQEEQDGKDAKPPPPAASALVPKQEEQDAEDAKPSVDRKPLDLSDSQLARTRLRRRWELASVLNFLRVFRSLTLARTKSDLSPEQIETALITPNRDLSDLHVAILKGIPPVNKNLSGPDAWITVLCKKLDPWWPWVAEGDIPLKTAHGEEISKYKELDAVTRLLLLKALCEIRALQDDAVSYINDALKQGNEICAFRKDRMAGDSTGVAFWNDGDAVMGYRLYREVTKIDLTPRKGKGRLTPPPASYQWETLATNLEEFQQVADKLSSSEIVEEAAVAKVIMNEIIPVLEGIQKKKEKALKRQQKQAMLLNGYFDTYRLEGTRSCRSRKPVSYTFDEYDKTIDEAIQLNMKKKKAQASKHGKKGIKHESGQVKSDGDSSNNEDVESQTDDEHDDCNDDNGVEDEGNDTDGDDAADSDEKLREAVSGSGSDSDSDSSDSAYDENDETDNDSNVKGNIGGRREDDFSGPGTRRTQGKHHVIRDVAGLRRSTRTGNADHSDIKTNTVDSDSETGSELDKDSSSGETSGGGKESSGVEEGSLEVSDDDD